MRKISEFINSNELFFFEEKFLGFFGIWPCGEIVNWKIWSALLFHIIFTFIPQINCLIEAIKVKNYLKVISIAPKLLIAIIIILSALSVLVQKDKFNLLINKIKFNWFKHIAD